MSTASQGLGKALARVGASGTVLALAEMSSDDILAGLNDDQRASLSAALAAPASVAAHPEPGDGEPDGDPDDANCSKCKGPMKDGKCAKCADASAEAAHEGTPAYAAGFAAATTRALAVMASDAFAGRAKAAATLLAKASLSADEITALLTDLGPAASGGESDPEAGARAEMQAALAETENSTLDASSGKRSSASADSSSLWAGAYSSIGLKPTA